jgi:Zn-dependent protease/CBS domain-containing protein
MSWSFRLGRIAGIPIYVHWTFLVLLAWIALGHWQHGQSLAATLQAVASVIAIFGCVVLHELGHALAARRYGVPTADITLLPIGGVARLQRIPEHPAEELVVALAGPAVNVVIAAVLLLVGVSPYPQVVQVGGAGFLIRESFATRLLDINIMLVVFNILPAFPMDGGRVLRALLAMALDYGRATRIAASVGQVMAIVFAMWGLGLLPFLSVLIPFIPAGGNPLMLLIALFVWIGAEAEAQQVQERMALRGISVRDAMLTAYQVLSPSDTLGHAAELLLAGSQHDFPVVVEGQPMGVLTRDSLLRALAEVGRTGTVADAPLMELETIEARAPLVPAVTKLREGGLPCLQVVEDGRAAGLLTLENIGELLMVRTALAEAAAHGPLGPARRPPGR